MKILLIVLFCLSLLTAQSQTNTKKYVGKYEANGMIVQIKSSDKELLLIVPGAPPQRMTSTGTNAFKTDLSGDETFVFAGKNGKIDKLISQRPGGSLELKKIADTTDNFNNLDGLMPFRKKTSHFTILYSKTDSDKMDHIAAELENNYNRILKDLKVQTIPRITVRVYPDRTSFLQGINFPNAPDFVMATAFGKDDIRMVSPNQAGMDSVMLIKGVVHEFTHCVHLNIDYAPNNPRWLWEGLAMFESEWSFDIKEFDFIKNKQFPLLDTLGNGMEYMLGYVIIEAIKDEWGFDKVIELVKKRGNMQDVLGIGKQEFNDKVFNRIYTKYIGAN